MRKQISKAMIIVLALVSLSQFVRAAPTPAPAPTDAANAYGLGVSMGFASFQSVVGGYDLPARP
jgi:hypothetical protein